VSAFISKDVFDREVFEEFVRQQQLSYTVNIIEQQNWNAVWESNFQPITVDDFVGVRAVFHEPMVNVEQEVIITPKMSFGTGHH
ncbi:50S ribosomal protein L11 methyltransferase, partial [Acinetobacter baumannii]